MSVWIWIGGSPINPIPTLSKDNLDAIVLVDKGQSKYYEFAIFTIIFPDNQKQINYLYIYYLTYKFA